MEFKISYSQTQVQEAAKFIWENNSVVKHWPSNPKSEMDIFNTIYDMALRDCKKNYETILEERKTNSDLSEKWIKLSGTGGFYIDYELLVDQADCVEIGFDVYVDPSIGVDFNKRSYIVEVVDYTADTV